jgi:hypothetical protein
MGTTCLPERFGSVVAESGFPLAGWLVPGLSHPRAFLRPIIFRK